MIAPPIWSRERGTAYRQITRIIVAYQVTMLRQAMALVHGDPTRTVVLMAIAKAQLAQDSGCAVAVERLTNHAVERLTNDAVERLTNHAIAHSLFLPHQTFNRHAAKLIEAGLCVRDGRSIALSDDPRIAGLLATLHGAVITLFDDLRRSAIPLPQCISATSEQLDRAIMAYGLGLSLIGAEYNGQENDNWSELHITGIVLEYNTRALRIAYPEQSRFGVDLAPVDVRDAIPPRAIAKALAMPHSTAARHIGRMVASGRLVRQDDGLVVATEWMMRPGVLDRAEAVAHYAARRMAALQHYGFDFANPMRHGRATNPAGLATAA